MALGFDIAGGSILGYQHLRKGQNNQDAFAYSQQREGTIAIVCDGCGSAPSSEVGAQLGAQLVLNTMSQTLQELELGLVDDQFWPTVQETIVKKLKAIALNFAPSIATFISDYLLFTVIGVVITPELTTLFGVGDGVFALNGEVETIGPFSNNAPPYLAYLLADRLPGLPPDFCDIKVYRQVATATVESVLIGSDGVGDWGAIASQPLPGKSERVGNLSQFWCEDRYFKNPDLIRRRLSLINRESIKADWAQQQLIKLGGLLHDDTTLVVMRRSGN
ncbi:MAG: protein phosphatase 2C domain-containing protein [Leptolyngbyaceae bacterium]|nr:protein phosphatase 2C domain-containing protein [Leptolyngbyaceae bacterium]